MCLKNVRKKDKSEKYVIYFVFVFSCQFSEINNISTYVYIYTYIYTYIYGPGKEIRHSNLHTRLAKRVKIGYSDKLKLRLDKNTSYWQPMKYLKIIPRTTKNLTVYCIFYTFKQNA